MSETIKDTLQYGVEFPAGSGQYHYDFELRLDTVEDHIEVYERPDILGGGISNMRVTNAVIAQCLVSLGTIPVDSITPELLSTAVTNDYDVLRDAQETLKKKRLRPKLQSNSETSALPPPSSGSTASETSNSGA